MNKNDQKKIEITMFGFCVSSFIVKLIFNNFLYLHFQKMLEVV